MENRYEIVYILGTSELIPKYQNNLLIVIIETSFYFLASREAWGGIGYIIWHLILTEIQNLNLCITFLKP